MKKAIMLFLGLILLLATTGCSRKTVAPIVVPVHDTLWQNHYEVDTMYTDRWQYIDRKGDTVWMVDSVIIYRAKHIHDTVREVNEVPVEVVKTETVTVEKKLNLWQKTTMWLGNILIFATLGIIAYKIWARLRLKK